MYGQANTMQALVFEQLGEAHQVLALRELPVPRPAAGQVLVEVEASPIHPADLNFIRGTYRIKPNSPQVAGLSGTGRVAAVGDGVTIALGSRVTFRWPGAWAQCAVVPVERVFLVPDDIDAEHASQFTVNPITAYGLLEVAHLQAGDWLGLTAASSSVAALVSALARSRGIKVLGIARDHSLRPLSAHVTRIAESEPELEKSVRAATAFAGLSALLDCVGGPLLGSLLPSVRQGGTIIAYGTLSPEPAAVKNATLIYANLTWQGFGIDRFVSSLTPAQVERMTSALWQGIRDHSLALPVQTRLELKGFEPRSAVRPAGTRERSSSGAPCGEPRAWAAGHGI